MRTLMALAIVALALATTADATAQVSVGAAIGQSRQGGQSTLRSGVV